MRRPQHDAPPTHEVSGEDTVAGNLDAAAPHPSDAPLGSGAAVGRYVVLRKLGAGGMGVVYVAFDPELDRQIALKVLAPRDRDPRRASAAQAQLVREAQAMAKLNHPNVIAVYDVGTHAGGVYVAMELVQGTTLRQWLSPRVRPWRAVLEVFMQAGHGLNAAHDSGIVHRDFKPDNVMVGDDGRVRVMDFGLAERSETGLTRTLTTTPEVDAQRERDSAPSDPRRPAGTPAYMAPEQHAAVDVGRSADQFAFCVALWEGLYGERPFRAPSVASLAYDIAHGKLREPPASPVPRWLRAVVERGLAVDPTKRWPNLSALLAALAGGHARRRRMLAMIGAGAIAAIAVGVVGYRRAAHGRQVDACAREGAAIEQTWNDEVRAGLAEGLRASGAANAAQTADKTAAWLDEYAAAWRSERTGACMAIDVQGTWDRDTGERARWCLDERREALGALLDALTRADVTAVSHAVAAVATLRQPARCTDIDLLRRLPAPRPDGRDAIDAVRALQAKAAALAATGAYDEGLAVARQGLAAAIATEWPPLVAAGRVMLGHLQFEAGHVADAEASLEAAYFEAVGAGATEDALAAADQLVHVVGVGLARPAEGLRWSKLAALQRQSLPDPGGLREASSLRLLAPLHASIGDFAEARALDERALALFEAAFGPDHPDVGDCLNNLATVLVEIGALAEAQTTLERALAIHERVYGSRHPTVATVLHNLGGIHVGKGEHDDARRLYERALAMREELLGPDHPDLANTLSNLAVVHMSTGAPDAAQPMLERALGISSRARGPEHPDVATTLDTLAWVATSRGDTAEARRLYERALAIMTKALGPEHIRVAECLNNLANAVAGEGDLDGAKPLYEQSLAMFERLLGPEHPSVAYPLAGLARVALAQDRLTDAVGLGERSLALRVATDAPPELIAESRMVLLRALGRVDPASSRARALAEQVREVYRTMGHDDLASVEAWLAEHPA